MVNIGPSSTLTQQCLDTPNHIMSGDQYRLNFNTALLRIPSTSKTGQSALENSISI